MTASLSSGFSGLTTAFVEHVRDEFPKRILWTTGMLENARGWKRTDTEVSDGHGRYYSMPSLTPEFASSAPKRSEC